MGSPKEISVNLLLKFQDFVAGFKKAGQEGEAQLGGLGKAAQKLEGTLGTVGKTALGVFGGGVLLGGVQGLMTGFEGLVHKGEEFLETENKLNIAFKGNAKDLEEAKANAEKYGSEMQISEEKLKNLSAQIALTGGITGDTNSKITNFSAGIEKMTGGTLSAETVMKGFIKGGQEGADSMGLLTRQFPELAAQLAGITSPAEKVAKAQEIMAAKFGALSDATQTPVEKLKYFSVQMEEGAAKVGAFLINAASPLISAFSFIADGLSKMLGWFEKMPTPIATAVKVVLGLVAGLALYNIASGLSIVNTIKDGIATTASTVAKVAASVATNVMTAAQWLLNAAMSANPIAIVVIALAALVAGIIWAYNNIDGFKELLGKLWEVIKTGIVFWLKWLNPVGLMVQAMTFLYDKIGFVKTAIDALGKAVSGAWTWLKGLVGITDDETKAETKSEAAIRAKSEALKQQKEDVDKLTASLATQQKTVDSANRQEIDNAKTRIIQDEIAQAAADKMLKTGHMTQAAYDEFTKKNRANMEAQKAYVQQYIDAVHQFEEQGANAEKFMGLAKDEPKPKGKDPYDVAKKKEEDNFKDQESRLKVQLATKQITESYYNDLSEANQLGHFIKLKKISDEFGKEQGASNDALAAFMLKQQQAVDKELLDDKLKHKDDQDKITIANDQKEKDRIARAQNYRQLEVDAMADGIKKQLALLDLQYESEKQKDKEDLDTKLIDRDQYELRLQIAQKNHDAARLQAIQDALNKENGIYRAASDGIAKLFDALTSKLKSILAHWLGWEQKEKTKSTAADAKLKEVERKKSEQSLEDEVRNNKISYEEYLAKKAKLKEDADNAEMSSEDTKAHFMRDLAEGATNSTIDNLSKLAEAQIQTDLQLILSKKASATGDLIESIFGTVPFPLNIALAAGAFGIISGLFSALTSGIGKKSKGAAEGLFHDPNRDGRYGQMIGIGETGKAEFAAPEETFVQYAEKRLTPKILSAVSHSTNPVTQRFSRELSGGIMPRIAPSLRSTEHYGNNAQLTTLLKHLVRNGVQSHLNANVEFKQHGEELVGVIRTHGRGVDNRASFTGGGLK